MPGYGSADRPRELPYTVKGYADHLAGILDQIGVSRAHLVLHDFGGPWGLQWAIDNPTAFASVTLINTGLFAGYRWHKFAKVWRTPIVGELFQATTTRAGLRLFLNRDNPKPLPDEFIDRIYKDSDRGMKRAVLKLYRSTDIAELAVQLSPALRALDRRMPRAALHARDRGRPGDRRGQRPARPGRYGRFPIGVFLRARNSPALARVLKMTCRKISFRG